MTIPARPAVLHVGKFYPPAPGGMERVVQLLCEGEQATTDSRVLVANTGGRTVRDTWRGVAVTRAATLWRIGSVGVCPTFPAELLRARRDLTVIHEPNPLALVADCITGQQGPLVVWFHSEVLRPQWKYRLMYRPFLRRVLRRASRIVVSSPNLAANAAELQAFRQKCVVIPFGIDTERLKPTERVRERAAAIADRFPGRRVLFVGRLVEYKGLEVLVRAMAGVEATALVIGDGPQRAALEALARASPSAERVRFLGHLSDDDVVAHLHACDAFVLPSITRAETFGVVQLEAMACGKPVVSTNLPTGVPWVNRDRETGFVVPPGDAPALASALRTLLENAPLRASLGASARSRALEHFTIEQMTRRSAALYREVLGETTTGRTRRLEATPSTEYREAELEKSVAASSV